MTIAIETTELTKHYGKTVALTNLDLQVNVGEVFGFLGPNGAGKTTTIRLLLDALVPTSGNATMLGLDPWRDRVELHRRIGYLPSELGEWSKLSAREWLAWVARIRGVETTRRVKELADRFHLDLSRRIGELSLGNRRKVGVVQAFMHDPELVILDEPTSGLDPLMQLEFRHLLIEWRNMGRTVFLSSHALDEVQHVADRVGIVRSGELVTVQSVSELLSQAVVHYEVHFTSDISAGTFRSIDHVRDVQVQHERAVFTVEGSPDALIKELAKHEISAFTCRNTDLEDVFLGFYGGTENGSRAR